MPLTFFLFLLFINHAEVHCTQQPLFFLAELRGLDRQSQIGFITLMEHLRYCTVGSFFKNPVHPVWVLGSDTHLTGKTNLLRP